MKVVLDTNFLIDLFRFKIGIEALEDFQIFLPQSVMRELKLISKKKTRESILAKVALEVLKKKQVTILTSFKTKTDDDLIEFAKQGYIVATNDRELRKRLKRLGFKTIYLRARKKIAVG